MLIIAYDWPNSATVGAIRPAKLAQQLFRHGWNPIVITAKPQYYEQVDPAETDGPTEAQVFRTRRFRHPRELYLWTKACFYKLTGRRQEFEESVRRGGKPEVPPTAYCSLKVAAKRFLISLLYVPDEYWGWFPFAVARSIKIVRREPIHCIISTGPPFTGHLVGLTIKKLFGLPWVADFRDAWTWNEAHSSEISSVVTNSLHSTLERMVMRNADRVVCVTPAMTERYSKMYPTVPSHKWVTITNGFDAEEFRQMEKVQLAPEFTISYVGSFDFQRSPKVFLEAVGQMIREGLIDRQRVRIRLVGPCRYAMGLSVEEMIAETGLKGVAEIAGFLPRTEALREMMRAHVLLLLAGIQKLTVAAKSYEYIGAGKPILAIAEEGATADLINRVGAGAVVPPGDHESIKRILNAWYAEYKDVRNEEHKITKPKWDVIKEYEWSELGSRYASVLDACRASCGERT